MALLSPERFPHPKLSFTLHSGLYSPSITVLNHPRRLLQVGVGGAPGKHRRLRRPLVGLHWHW